MLPRLITDNTLQKNVFNKISPKILSPDSDSHFFAKESNETGHIILKLRLLNDVDASQLKDGSMIQYSSSSDKFVVRDEITTTTGSITLNGGNF